LVKELDPTAAFHELDIDDRLTKQQQQFDAKLEKRDKEDAIRRAAEERQRNLEALTRGGLSDDDVSIDPTTKVSKIEQFMLDR
jgi:hypothetical protein